MSKPIVYILNGSGGCGKDTFVDLCNQETDNAVWHISTITPFKAIAEELGWNGEKTEEIRKFLSDLKKVCNETFDISFKYITRMYKLAIKYEYGYLFIDSREPHEIARLCKEFNAQSIYIDASKRIPMITSNESDAQVQNYQYDIYIDNNGNLEQLREKAKEFIQKGDEILNGIIN